MKKYLLLSVILLFQFIPQLFSGNSEKIRLLILSGRNNHEWQQTTSFLENLFLQSGLFSVSVTEKPDTLKLTDFQKFNVVLSNWNSWPENDLRWPDQTEKALFKFIESGGGFVTFHASSSAFYKWPEFQQISVAPWVMDTTSHGKRSETKVSLTNHKHPVTNGLPDFTVFDELWINAGSNPDFEILGIATNQESIEKGIGPQPAIFVKEHKRGRIFHTILGHDVKAIESEGFQKLILRGTEWAATGKVSKK